jgi:hypothetical protein
MTEGQDLFAQQKSEGIKLLRQAYELDENNSLARAVLANALVEQAHSIVEGDWREAEKLAREALDLNPGHPMAKTIRTLILDQKRETFVEECVSQARKLQTATDLAGALSRIEEGLSVYPREPRLIQIQETVQRDLQAQRRQTRRRDLEELRRMESEIDAATDVASKQALGERVRAVADRYSKDGEVLSIANGFLHRLGLLEVAQENPTGSPESDSATLTYHTPPVSAPEPSLAGTSNASAPPPVVNAVAAKPAPPPVPPAPPLPATARPAASAAKPLVPAPKAPSPSASRKQPAGSPQRRTTIFATVAAIVLVGAIFLFVRKHHAPPVTPTPEAAPAVSTSATPSPQPALSALKLSSDISTGRVTFDDQPPAEFQEGQWVLDQIPTGEHKLKIDGPQGSTSFTFSTDAGGVPVVKGPIVSSAALAVVVSSMAGHLHLYSSDSSTKVSVDGQAPLDVPQDGLDLPSISAGAHELAVTRGSDQYKLDIDAGTTPALTTFLESGQNVGTMVVIAGQDKAKVFLNGKLQPQLTQGGQLRIPNLELKDYVVRVSKSGFQDLPEQKIRIRKGEGKVIFNLQPIPHLASLTIQGGVPGATVLVDQTPVGTIQADGTLTVATINPGDHVVELRKDRFKPRQIKKHFVVGTAASLAAADVALDAAPGDLKITFTPADAQVTLAKVGETPTKVISGSALSLSAGSYTLTAKTADNFARASTVEVLAGQSKNLDLSLAPSGMSKWDDPAGWKQEKGSFVHKGGDFVMYSVAPTSGTFVFSAMLTKGHRLQWVLNCTDVNNYVLFQMDDNNFYRTVIRNGQKGDETKIPHKGDKKSFRTIQIRVGPNEIVHQIRQGESWVALDRWTQPGSNLTLGKFGFYIPGNDQVALSTFGHYLDLNTR